MNFGVQQIADGAENIKHHVSAVRKS